MQVLENSFSSHQVDCQKDFRAAEGGWVTSVSPTSTASDEESVNCSLRTKHLGSDKSIMTNTSVDSGIGVCSDSSECTRTTVKLRNRATDKPTSILRTASKSFFSNLSSGGGSRSSKSRSASSKSLLSLFSVDLSRRRSTYKSTASIDSIVPSVQLKNFSHKGQIRQQCNCAMVTSRQHVRAAIQSRFMMQMTIRQNR